MRNRHAEAGYLEFVVELVDALLAREDEHVRRLVADALATALPVDVLDEVHGILRLPAGSLRAPIRTLRHLQITLELVADEARHSKARARRRAKLLRRGRAGGGAGGGASHAGDPGSRDVEDGPQLGLDFPRRPRAG